MLTVEQEGSNSPTFRLSPLLNSKHLDIPETSESRQDHGSFPGTPFDPSDSDYPSDPHNSRLFAVPEISSTGDSNALGLVFTYEMAVFGGQAVATSIPRAESLRAPQRHQDARSRDRPNQEHRVQQEHLVPQPDGTADETLAGGFPQDICLGADVSHAPGLKVSRNNRDSVPVIEKSFGGCRGQTDTAREPMFIILALLRHAGTTTRRICRIPDSLVSLKGPPPPPPSPVCTPRLLIQMTGGSYVHLGLVLFRCLVKEKIATTSSMSD